MKKKIIVILVLIGVVIIGLFVRDKINRKQEEPESLKAESYMLAIMIGNMPASYEYVDREINIDYFYDLDGNTTYEEIEKEIGKPNGTMGSGIITPYYQVGNQYVVIRFATGDDGKYSNILRMALYTNEGYVEDIPFKVNANSKTDSNNAEQASIAETEILEEKQESTDYDEGTDKSNENINYENPYFYSQTDCFFSADIQYIDVETVTTINGELELQWLKEYNNGNLYKLMVKPDGNMIDYLGEERLNIYFYVTADKIYRLWSYTVLDGNLIEFYNNDTLLIETLNTDEKLVENGELVCCMEDKSDELELSEVGKHVTIVQQGEQITYNRVDIGENGSREFYETFVWAKGKGLVEYKSGYRMEADILYIENILMKSEK